MTEEQARAIVASLTYSEKLRLYELLLELEEKQCFGM